MRIRVLLWVLFFSSLLYEMHNKGGGLKQDLSLQNLMILILSLLGCLTLFLLVECLQNRKARVFGSFLYGITFFYFFRVSYPFSFELIANNFDHLTDSSSLQVIAKLAYATFFASDVFWSLIFAGLIFLSERWDPLILKTKQQRNYLLSTGLSLALVLSVAMQSSYDPFSAFLQSIYAHYVPKKNLLDVVATELPLLTSLRSKTHFSFEKPPNIFLILIESFNSRFVNQRSEEGIEFLPFFNELSRRHLYFSNYYSNSIQTAKGHFAAICGQVPMTRGIEFQSAQNLSKKCLPSVLSDNGYKTFFFQSDPNFNSDNSQNFMKSHGFQFTPELAKHCTLEETKCYSYGIRDHLFYDRVFRFLQLDDHLKDHSPFFAALATVSTHMPFSFQSEDERPIYKNPKNFKEQYLNTIRMADESLRHLIDQFEKSTWAKNSILVITGDHGFPTGEHGSIHNDNYAYQENFGVPLLIYDTRQDLKSVYALREKLAFSHLNLGMTLTDLAQIETQTDWIASSVFDFQAPSTPVYLVQPYSGGYQASIDWPYKHIFASFREVDVIYNLEDDPHEHTPILPHQNQKLFDKMRKITAQIYRQQEIFEFSTNERKLGSVSPDLDDLSVFLPSKTSSD